MNYGVITDPTDRKKLVRKIRELVPGIRSVDLPNAAAREAYRNKLEAMEEVFESAELGLNVSHDNRKIGAIDNFSLPPGWHFRAGTCPGATRLCEEICYATRGPGAQFQEWRYFVNWAYIELWPDRFVDVFSKVFFAPVVRVHVGGDYYSIKYLRLWKEIVKNQRHRSRFYSYTRSWQNGRGRIKQSFLQDLRELSRLENMRLILSVDAETGIPPSNLVPASIRAWLARNDLDMPPRPVELIFRDPSGMSEKMMSKFPGNATSQRNGSPVCPIERWPRYIKKDGMLTCQNCAWCWGGAHQAYGRRQDRLELFDMWARTYLAQRIAKMFAPFVPGTEHRTPRSPGMGDNKFSDFCVCGCITPCTECGACVYCTCECPA